MSGARDQILDTIRKGRGRGAVAGAERAALEARLGAHRRGTIPARVDKDAAAPSDLFVAQAETLSATVDRVGSVDDVPVAVAAYLARENLFGWPLFGSLIRFYDAIPIQRDGLGLGGVKETLRRLIKLGYLDEAEEDSQSALHEAHYSRAMNLAEVRF